MRIGYCHYDACRGVSLAQEVKEVPDVEWGYQVLVQEKGIHKVSKYEFAIDALDLDIKEYFPQELWGYFAKDSPLTIEVPSDWTIVDHETKITPMVEYFSAQSTLMYNNLMPITFNMGQHHKSVRGVYMDTTIGIDNRLIMHVLTQNGIDSLNVEYAAVVSVTNYWIWGPRK